MRVLITGASGLLGTGLLRTAPREIEVIAGIHTRNVPWPTTGRADLRDPAEAADLVERTAPDVIIHAAYTRDRPGVVDTTRNVVVSGTARGASTVLVSSDVVFRGDGRPRSEMDPPAPVSDYGRWKRDAEILTVRVDSHATVVRLPLLISIDPPDPVVARVRRAAQRGETVGWYAGERRQPANTLDVAEGLWRVVALERDRRLGVWHLPGPERLSRRELGSRVAAAIGVEDPGVAVPAPPATDRPRDLHLTDERARNEIAWRPRRVLEATSERNS